ncbi:MAG: pirin family protein [Bacteroidota bacterium]|nr:pirin family protein [Bacteroidota bacterium]
MFIVYRHNELVANTDLWGESAETFFGSDNEKYLGFGNLVQLKRTSLKNGADRAPMKIHKNIEVVDIILNGSVEFQDSSGQVSSFPANTLQVLSAGKGIYQQEFNLGDTVVEKIRLEFLPDMLNQSVIKTKALFDLQKNKNSFVELISPSNASSLTIRQQAAVLLGEFAVDQHIGYRLNNKAVGLFVYVVSGKIAIQNTILSSSEAVGITDEEQTILHTLEPSILLVIEVELVEQLENS